MKPLQFYIDLERKSLRKIVADDLEAKARTVMQNLQIFFEVVSLIITIEYYSEDKDLLMRFIEKYTDLDMKPKNTSNETENFIRLSFGVLVWIQESFLMGLRK